MKKVLSILLCIFLPNIFVQLYLGRWSDNSIIGTNIFLYFITIIGLIIFYKFRPCNMWILPLGFLLPVAVCYMNDTLNNSEWLTYLDTTLVTIYYSIPFIIITVILALVHTRRKGKIKSSCFIKLEKSQILKSGAVLIVFISIVTIYSIFMSSKHMVRRNIIQKIDIQTEQETECIFKLSDVTKFKWDTVAYFEYPVTESQITEELGVTYNGSTDLMEGFIFAYKGRVVHKDVVSISPGNINKARLVFDGGPLTVLKENEAVFEGRKIDDTLYKIKVVYPEFIDDTWEEN